YAARRQRPQAGFVELLAETQLQGAADDGRYEIALFGAVRRQILVGRNPHSGGVDLVLAVSRYRRAPVLQVDLIGPDGQVGFGVGGRARQENGKAQPGSE